MEEQESLQFHIHCRKGQVGRYVFLPGDPGRVERIAAYLEKAKPVAQNREFTTYTGFLDGEPVSVTSTGIGGPSASIALEELIRCGADTFLRIGTCGGMQEDIPAGTLILPTGAIRMEGTTREYLPIEYPAVPDFTLLCSLTQAAKQLGYPFRTGVVHCKDSFYGQHSPQSMPVSGELKAKWEAWRAAGALASEMESAALFAVAATRRVRCATVLLVIWNQERTEGVLEGKGQQQQNPDAAIQVAVQAMRAQIAQDRRKRKQEV